MHQNRFFHASLGFDFRKGKKQNEKEKKLMRKPPKFMLAMPTD
jgi:FAD synthase